MKSEVLSRFDLINLPIIALVIFFTLFIGVVVWSIMKENKMKFQKASHMPLDEGNKNE
jgi:cbb3-type cytochrome oxidase subunit 3